MKKSIRKTLCLMSCIFFCVCSLRVDAVDIENLELTSDEFLVQTGMSQEQIEELDPDIKEFIVEDLKKRVGNDVDELQNVEIKDEPMILPKGVDNLTGIRFGVTAFRENGNIHIYPEYEFTDKKNPKGEDSFSFQLGDAVQPYEFGGQLWVLDDRLSLNWMLGGSLTPTSVNLNGATYSGDKLGDLMYPMRLKGCLYCHAREGSGTDKGIAMNYVYNPNKFPYSISFSYKNIGISVQPPGTVYSAGDLMIMSY